MTKQRFRMRRPWVRRILVSRGNPAMHVLTGSRSRFLRKKRYFHKKRLNGVIHGGLNAKVWFSRHFFKGV